MAFLSGTTGYVKVGSATYAFGKWKLALKGGAPKVTNFAGLGYQQLVGGVKAGTITLSGAYDQGNMPLQINTTYTFHLGLALGIELALPAQVSDIDVDNDVEDAPRVTVTAQSTGEFNAQIS